MKWGVRKEYVSVAKEGSKALSDAARIGSGQKTKKKNNEDYSKLTNEELQRRVNRLNLEENYGRLTGKTKMVRSGGEWVKEILQDTAIGVGLVGSALSIFLALKKAKGG